MRKRILGAVAVALLASASVVAGTGQALASTSSANSEAGTQGLVMHYAGSYTGAEDGSGSSTCEAAGRKAVSSGEAVDYTCNWVQTWIYDLYLINNG